MKLKDVLYVPGLTKNLFCISALDKKGFSVAFIDGEVLMWPKGKTIEAAIVIGTEEGGLYKLKGHSDATLIHSFESPCELWHRRLAHINYKAFVGMFYRQRMLVIDGKYNNDDGLSTTTMINSAVIIGEEQQP
jgi:hypothetical protein